MRVLFVCLSVCLCVSLLVIGRIAADRAMSEELEDMMAYEEAELMDMVASLSMSPQEEEPHCQRQQNCFASPLSPPTTSTIVDESGERRSISGPAFQRQY